MWNRIHEEEETDLVGSEISRFNAIVSEYTTQLNTLSTRHQTVLSEFSAELTEFNSKFTTVMDVWSKYQMSYAKSNELIQAEILRLESDYQKDFYPKHYQ